MIGYKVVSKENKRLVSCYACKTLSHQYKVNKPTKAKFKSMPLTIFKSGKSAERFAYSFKRGDSSRLIIYKAEYRPSKATPKLSNELSRRLGTFEDNKIETIRKFLRKAPRKQWPSGTAFALEITLLEKVS